MNTIGFREKEKGWTSFFSFEADEFLRVGNTFFSIKEGNLWEHNDRSNPITNTFYGIKYPSKISTVFNDVQTEDKIFKTFSIEGSAPWDIEFVTNLTQTTLSKSNFDKRESRYFTHLRGNELSNDFSGNSQGVGVCVRSNGKTLFFGTSISDLVNVNDSLFMLDNDKHIELGVIESKTADSISVDKDISVNVKGMFFFSSSNSRVDGGEIRGYYAQVDMSNDDDKQIELFAINSNIVKSYV